LLKTGSERIPQQSAENIHIFKALTEYRFTDKDGKDQGVNVREKAKIVLVLIEDEEKRKEERDFAMKTKDKLTKAPSASSATGPDKEKAEIPPYTGLPSLDNIPSVADLTAAMAKKKEEQKRLEAERKEAERRAKEGDTEPDLWEKAATAAPSSNSDPWGAPSDASNESAPATNDPWGPWSDDSKESSLATNDPWASSPPTATDPWGAPSAPTDDLFGDGGRPDPWGSSSENGTFGTGDTADETKKPASFLGEGASLVDLDSLMSVKPKPKQPPLNAIPTQKAPGKEG
ncbi:hypothetical protein cypCar_00013503, partial [Cyprinus carpio]